jgi:hypothetical protein
MCFYVKPTLDDLRFKYRQDAYYTEDDLRSDITDLLAYIDKYEAQLKIAKDALENIYRAHSCGDDCANSRDTIAMKALEALKV